MSKALQTFAVSKHYPGGVCAVDGVSLSVRRGEIYGFLGLNGAGKSTLIRMLLGMVTPTSGHVEIFGERVRAGTIRVWRRVGYLVDTATAYPELTVRENLEIARRYQLMTDRSVVARLIESLSLATYADRRAQTLSLGNLQRLALARAMLHQPELLILDEPANALDPAGVVEMRELLRRLVHEHGVTVFMSSHVLAEVEQLATRIAILHRGCLIEELDVVELEHRCERRLEVGARDLLRAEAVLVDAGFAPRRVKSSCDDGQMVLELRDARALEEPDAIACMLSTQGSPPMRLILVQEGLEQHFLRVVQRADGDQ